LKVATRCKAASFAAGHLVHLIEASRLVSEVLSRRKAVAAEL
jgi:hypothetical protein